MISDNTWDTMDPGKKEVLTAKALKAGKQAYLVYLFLLMANGNHYGKVKATIDDSFLLRKQDYPQDLLAAKRLLADFKRVVTPKKKAEEMADVPGIAFVEKEGP